MLKRKQLTLLSTRLSSLVVEAVARRLGQATLCAATLVTLGNLHADPTTTSGSDASGIFSEYASSPVNAIGAFVHGYPFELPRPRGNLRQSLSLGYTSSAAD